MTHTPQHDTSAAAVERLAHRLEVDDPWCQPKCHQAADTIRALADERDAIKAAADELADAHDANRPIEEIDAALATYRRVTGAK